MGPCVFLGVGWIVVGIAFAAPVMYVAGAAALLLCWAWPSDAR